MRGPGARTIDQRAVTLRAVRSRATTQGASVLDELPSRESRIEVVPVADVLALAEHPAEVDLAPAAEPTEVDEPFVGVLHLRTETGDLDEQRVDLLRDRIRRAAVIRLLAPLQVFQQRSHLWEERFRL